MDKRTLTALQGSIAKWKAIEEGRGYDGYADNCPLCHVFLHADDTEVDNEECVGCPIRNAGFPGCLGSPWSAWDTLCRDLGRIISTHRTADTPALIAAARAEREFLESLLPKDVAEQT